MKADVRERHLACAVRSTGAGGCDGRISANATWMMPPARPSVTPMRQAMVSEPSASYSARSQKRRVASTAREQQ
ncbi:hypothetical protein ABIF44_001603 [Bradyrhizobium japonicum]|nr:hypothetical protein [Bradyrhizobium japonicum]AJA62759.1 hypothetical protein RN69_22265 [Bradyrhizobium japonicum]KMJ98561.1 hypothetical protein CF64_15395 [Bradyrhizobium japonicum]MBR0730103.1 hypothetical protein [Bradyrhizobium japonicum]MBR0809117.1 hypothetical protein [Bradyrhizobium japonicum]MCS3540724.1 hypothetical protein [Bradyrhizobium japonicum]